MTSMPASRNARAITLAPRSWPSSPGLATNTRIGLFIQSDRARFPIGAEHIPQSAADFAERGISADSVQNIRHGVLRTLGRAPQRIQRPGYSRSLPPGPQRHQLAYLALMRHLIDLKDLDGFLVTRLERIDTYDNLITSFNLPLIAVAGVGDFSLGEAALDGGDHAAHLIDAADVIPRGLFGRAGEMLQKIAAAERIGRGGDAALIGDHLLGAQRNDDGMLAGQRIGFVERIGVQRLRAAENSRHRLQRGAHDVVLRLLPGERASGGLRMKAQLQAALGLGAEAVAHEIRPKRARRAILGDLLEKVVVRVEEKAQPGRELVDLEASLERPLDVLHAIA